MSAPINDGGPAFPHFKTHPVTGCVELCPQDGMSLRDYFAGQALAGALADPTCDVSPIELAKIAYREADAMLAAREATK
jgi:hypothetical protein